MLTERATTSLLSLFRPKPKEVLQATCFFALLITWLFWPVWPLLNSHYIGGASADAGLYVWLTKTVQQNLALPWFNTKAFFPYGLSLAWSDNFFLPSLAVSVLHALGLSHPMSFNLLILSCYFLSALCSWEASFKITNSQPAALFSAAAFCAYGFLIYHLGHPQLQFTFFLPLVVSLCFELISRSDPKLALLLGLVIFFSFLCAVYYSVFCAIICITLLASARFLRPALWDARQILQFSLAFLLGLLPIVPFALPYLEAKSAFGGRALYEAYYFSADLYSYFSASPLNFLYSFSAPLSHAEAHLFPGICLVMLALFALNSLGGTKKLDRPFLFFIAALLICLLASTQVKANFLRYVCAFSLWAALILFANLAWRISKLEKELGFAPFSNRALLCGLFFAALLFFALSLGPLGNPEKGHLPLGVFAAAHLALPGLDAMRAASRAGVVVILFLSLVSAFSVKRLLARYSKHSSALILTLLAIILIENYTIHLPLEPDPPSPEVLQELKDKAGPNDVAIFLPLTSELKPGGDVLSWRDFAIRNVRAMNWSANLPNFIVNGYSGQRSKLMKEFPGRLENFPDAKSIKTLEQILGLRFIVVDLKALPLDLTALPSNLKLLKSDTRDFALIEFEPLTQLDENLTLLAPAFTSSAVLLELINVGKNQQTTLPLDVYLDGQPFFAIDLSSSNQPSESFKLSLPAGKDKLRPARLTFKLPPDAQVFLRKRAFSLEK